VNYTYKSLLTAILRSRRLRVEREDNEMADLSGQPHHIKTKRGLFLVGLSELLTEVSVVVCVYLLQQNQ
jgi:hypothetical protein